jgi:hypothetical protein
VIVIDVLNEHPASLRQRRCHSGLRARWCTVHATAAAVVSLPATNMVATGL